MCNAAKAQQQQARRVKPESKPELTYVGELLLADYIVLGKEEHQGLDNEPCALFLCDAYSDLRDSIPLPSRSAKEAKLAMSTFVGPTKVKRVYSDRGRELIKAVKECEWVHDNKRYTPQARDPRNRGGPGAPDKRTDAV